MYPPGITDTSGIFYLAPEKLTSEPSGTRK